MIVSEKKKKRKKKKKEKKTLLFYSVFHSNVPNTAKVMMLGKYRDWEE